MSGHNRWHPDIEPICHVAPGQEITLEARDGTAGQIDHQSTHDDLLVVDYSNDLLTGPVYVEGAEVGDVVSIECLRVECADFGYTAIVPGIGLLSDIIPGPYLVKWEIDGAHARSEELPGVAVPGAPFPGTVGVAPSHELVTQLGQREAELWARAGSVPEPFSAPPVPSSAAAGLGTLPPRENGGNLDVRQLSRGGRLLLPVHVPGALVSLGDVHFAQGEGEVCGSAIETRAMVTLRLDLIKAPRWTPRFPAFETADQPARRYFGTTGLSITDDGRNEYLDLNLAARGAVLEMIEYLCAAYGFTREASYALASVAVDLRVAEVVDIPNAIVVALLPLDIFLS
jgi:formamidase